MTSVLVTLEAPQVTLTLKLPAAALVAMGQDQVTAPLASAVASFDVLGLGAGAGGEGAGGAGRGHGADEGGGAAVRGRRGRT